VFSLLSRLFGSKLPMPARIGVFVIVGVVVAVAFHEVFYGIVLAVGGGFGAWRQGHKTSFAAAPVVPEPLAPGFITPAAAQPPPPPPGATPDPGPPPAAPAAPPPPSAPQDPSAEGGSIYGPG
jgi:hypothetical protein